MSNDLRKIGESLEAGNIPSELNIMREFGKILKENPDAYARFRQQLLDARSTDEQLTLLKNLTTTDDNLRRLVADNASNPLGVTVTVTVTVTVGMTTKSRR